MHEAVKYALETREAYATAWRSEMSGDAAIGSSLIVVGAAVLGLSAFDASRDAITGTALGGGTIFANAQWLRSPERKDIYVAGMQGLDCTLTASAAYGITDRQGERIEAALRDLNTALTSIRSTYPQATAEGTSCKPPDLNTVTAVLEAGSNARALAQSTLAQHETAPARLVATVTRIDGLVTKAISDRAPSLDSIAAVIQDLAGSARVFAPDLEFTKDEAKRSEELLGEFQSTRDAEVGVMSCPGNDRLAMEVSSANAAIEELSAFTGSARLEEYAQALAACGIASVAATPRLTLSASVVSLPLKEGASATILITAGDAPYQVSFTERPGSSLILEPPIFGGRAIRVEVGPSPEHGVYKIAVVDVLGQMRVVTINVGGSQLPAASGVSSQRTEFMGARLAPETTIEELQQKLCTSVDGVVGERTRRSWRQFEDWFMNRPVLREQGAQDGVASTDEINLLLSLPQDCSVPSALGGATNFFESRLTEAEAEAIVSVIGGGENWRQTLADSARAERYELSDDDQAAARDGRLSIGLAKALDVMVAAWP
ncbi:MAG: hypothetical protein JJT88_05525 [Gammaproteobacteria bacterium]|nr:hypothetical protein [Gammaproteobacteria bacterium]